MNMTGGNFSEEYKTLLAQGISLYHSRDLVAAEKEFHRLTISYPQGYEGWYWLGNVYSVTQQAEALEKAVVAYQQAKSIAPLEFMNLFHLGCSLQELGRYAEAVNILREALSLNPGHARAICTLAICLCKVGEFCAAKDCFEKALLLEPDSALLNAQYGYFLEGRGELARAREYLQRALKLDSGNPAYVAGLGRILVQLGRLDEARDCLQKVPQQLSRHPAICTSFGLYYAALGDVGDFSEAIKWYDLALAQRPEGDDLLGLKAQALLKSEALTASLESMQRALELAPEVSSHYQNYANILLAAADGVGAVAAAQKAAELESSDCLKCSNFLFYLHYINSVTREDILRLHRQWGEHYSAGLVVNDVAGLAAKVKARGGRVRLGFVSGDFRAHAAAFFLLPLLRELERDTFEVYCYTNFCGKDGVTRQLESLSEYWRDISQLNDNSAADCILADNLNILVDLSGHTAYSRLSIFLRRLALVQVSWLGYPDTTGLSTIDYRIVDECAEPEREGGKFSTEQLLRLAGGFHCYLPPQDCPNVSSAPGLENGYITFGSFNNPAKISAECVELWSAVLRELPDSRLLLKAHGMGDVGVQQRLRERFAACGVDGNRLEFAGKTQSVCEHLAVYSRVDIALDTFPYCGTTTTCEALWMGVPVVSLIGDRHCSRMGLSLLTSAGIVENACRDYAEFVRRCRVLAQDISALAATRLTAREKLQRTALCDADSFARRFAEKLLYINAKALS